MEYKTEQKRVKPLDEQADFVISFVDDSRDKRAELEDVWDETEHNFLVRPLDDISLGSSTKHPLQSTLAEVNTPRARALSVLKDPETHQEVTTIVSKIMLSLFPEPGFAKARGVGFEDIHSAAAVGKLTEYLHRLPGHYIVFMEWLFGIGIFGTGIIKQFWDYQEETRNVRVTDIDPLGFERTDTIPMLVPTWDDPRLTCVDIRDFFNDPGVTQMSRMSGCAERFKMTAAEAYRKAAQGIYEKAAVDRAVERRLLEDARETEDKPYDDPTTLSNRSKSHPDFVQLVGYEYVGETPFKAGADATPVEDGIGRRVITLLGGETVRSKPFPRRLPYFDGRIIPRLNSFYGVAPAEVIRYDQDFADTLKMMLADAVIRATHPPLIYDKDGDVELAKLRAFRPRVPVGARFSRGNPIEQLQYNPPVQPAFAMYTGVKQQMREASGALGAVQGLGLGTKRFSASEAAATFEQALDRPEMFAAVLEREYLPPIAKFALELYQEFLPDGPEGQEELAKRIGHSQFPVEIRDVLAGFDIEFVGSRISGGRAQELQAFREIVAASANPIIAQLTPWIPLLQKWFNALGAHEIAAMVGNPQMVQVHMMLNQIGGTNEMAGNGNGTLPSAPPAGLLPAQVQGGQL